MKRLLVVLFVALLGTGLFAQEVITAYKTNKSSAKDVYSECPVKTVYISNLKGFKSIKADTEGVLELIEGKVDLVFKSKTAVLFDDDTLVLITPVIKTIKEKNVVIEYWSEEMEDWYEDSDYVKAANIELDYDVSRENIYFTESYKTTYTVKAWKVLSK